MWEAGPEFVEWSAGTMVGAGMERLPGRVSMFYQEPDDNEGFGAIVWALVAVMASVALTIWVVGWRPFG